MPTRNSRKEYAPDTYYHVYSRGLNKQPIFFDEQDFIVFENRGAGVELRGLVALFAAEQTLDGVFGHLGFTGDHLGGDLPDARKTLPVEFIFGIGESVLGQRLQLDRPPQPGFVPVIRFIFHKNPLSGKCLALLYHVNGKTANTTAQKRNKSPMKSR